MNREAAHDSLADRRWWLKMLLTPALLLTAALLAIVALGLAQRLGWISAGTTVSSPAAAAGSVTYTCPMHPHVRQPSPGRCPECDMELVVAAAGGSGDLDELAVNIEPAARRVAGITTVKARKVVLDRTIRTVGNVTFDESRLATIVAYVDGRIERVFADYTGVPVAKGDHLVVLFSPTLYVAQFEFLDSRKDPLSTSLAEQTRQRLIELGMTEEQVKTLEREQKAQSRLTIYSPVGGTVIEKTAVEGLEVKKGQTLYRIADLSVVWLVLELFPEDAASIRFGQKIQAQVHSLPGETFVGRVAFIAPIVDTRTRTVKVRVEVPNPDGRLRPGDYASASIAVPIGPRGEVYDADLAGKWISPMHPQIIRDQPGTCPVCGMPLVPTSRYGYATKPVPPTPSLVVPRDAVLIAGNNSVVYVEVEEGKFELRQVTLGAFTAEDVVILKGLEEGAAVARSGNFLIDSQMQLAGKPSLIDPSRAKAKEPGPLELEDIRPRALAGQSGKFLEELLASYLGIQAALAADKRPGESDAKSLYASARSLAAAADTPENIVALADVIAENAEHLHHLDIDKARKSFKPISHATIRLAARARGTGAKTTLIHFYCPMVKGGGGDWLQATEPLANPYYGSEMLRCGEDVHELPPPEQQ